MSEYGEGRPPNFHQTNPGQTPSLLLWLGAIGDGTKLPMLRTWENFNSEMYLRYA